MKLRNFETTKLDHLLTIGQSSGKRNGLGYTNVENTIGTFSKAMFVKSAPPTKVSSVFDKTFNPLPFGGKMKFQLCSHLLLL